MQELQSRRHVATLGVNAASGDVHEGWETKFAEGAGNIGHGGDSSTRSRKFAAGNQRDSSALPRGGVLRGVQATWRPPIMNAGNALARDRLPSVLRRYFRDPAVPRVMPLGNSGGFSGAALWRVECDAGVFALRRWPPGTLPRRRILGLHALLGHLAEHGLTTVAVPLSAGGTTLCHDAGADWQLEPWLPGIADFHADPRAERLEQAMQALAQWHLAARRFPTTSDNIEWFGSVVSGVSPAVQERVVAMQTLDDPLLARFSSGLHTIPDSCRRAGQQIVDGIRIGRRAVLKDLHGCLDLTVPLQPCLRDIWHDHVLFTGVAVSGIIDPSACRRECVAADLARLLRSLLGPDPLRWCQALDAYERLRPLSSEERRLIPVLDRSGVLLSGATWLNWLTVERRVFDEVSRVETRLHDIARSLQFLTA